MSVVWVTQEVPGRNLTPARQFGELRLLLPSRQILLAPEQAIKTLYEKLSGQNLDDDYLVLIGDPIAIGMSVFVAAECNGGVINVLKWDRETRSYNPVKLDLWGNDGNR